MTHVDMTNGRREPRSSAARRTTALLGPAVATFLTPAVLAAQDGAELFGLNLGLSFWTVVVFLILLFLLSKFAWGPILSAVEAREERIQNALDESAQRQAEAQRLLEEHKQQLADARRQAQEIISEGKAAGDRVRREIEEKAREEGQNIIERARREIEREKEAALAELRKESVDLAMAAAGRLMQERMDSAKDRELVMGYLDDLGGKPAPGARATGPDRTGGAEA